MSTLSDEQLAVIADAAARLPSRWRAKFEQIVAAQLGTRALPITDIAVHAIVIAVKRAVSVGIGVPTVGR